MSETIPAYPLLWPPGWKRCTNRTRAKFSGESTTYRDGNRYTNKRELTITEGITRVRQELQRMGLADYQIVISSNLPLRLDGLPRAGARAPADPGVAVYWKKGNATRCMAIDRYDRVADNLAAIAATLDAMRAIERHGGAEVLDRAFTGFTALPAPEQWFQVLGVSATASKADIEKAFKRLAMEHHPDRGGDSQQMARINQARDDGISQARA
ncbi:MAG TPA: J domain-containing protein [Steroidobacteraceae bacterium]|nr:J domain-containing protein [Steroidobacteraceae bacterium]